MTHDDRCPGWFKEDEQISCPTCDVIARVREDERSLVAVERTTLTELNAEYRKGVQAAREAVAAVRGWFTYDYPDDIDASDALPVVLLDDALTAIDRLTPDRGNGGHTTLRCHYCQQPITVSNATFTHLTDGTPLCTTPKEATP